VITAQQLVVLQFPLPLLPLKTSASQALEVPVAYFGLPLMLL